MGGRLPGACEVSDLIRERLGITIFTAFLTLIFTYAIAVPIGIYSATRQYSAGDYFFTILGFVGLAMPTFFLALVLMYYVNRYTGFSVGGLYSPQFMNQPMSLAKFVGYAQAHRHLGRFGRASRHGQRDPHYAQRDAR